MTATAHFELDDDAFLLAIADAADVLQRTGEADLEQLAELAVDRMVDYVPVDTGELRDSLDARPGRDENGFFVDVGSFDNDHNWYVEFGTSKMAAQSYQRPGLAEGVVLWLNTEPPEEP